MPRSGPTPGPAARAFALCAAVAAGGAGCGANPAPPPIRPEVDLHHPSGTVRAQAVAAVAGRRDARHVPALIDALDDDDEAVRLSASATLRELTGHDTGYKAYLPREERRRHQELWRAWWAGRGAGAAPAAPARPAPVPAPPPPSAPRSAP